MGRKPVRCEHCNTPISKQEEAWIHYPVRKGTHIGERFFGCHFYDSTINQVGADSYIKATPKKEVPSNA